MLKTIYLVNHESYLTSITDFIITGVLMTTNMNTNSLAYLKALRANQPNKPLYVSEFWPGWYDSWGDKSHHTMTIQHFEKEVTDILFNANSSINYYMFFGGTNFMFTNGGGVTTSYDYNAPLSERGIHFQRLFTKYIKTKIEFQAIIPISIGKLKNCSLN